MHVGDYYKILVGDQIVGGVIVLRKRPREYELGRIFVDPDYQNQGVGTQAFEFLWQEYPLAKKWTLGTRLEPAHAPFLQQGGLCRGGVRPPWWYPLGEEAACQGSGTAIEKQNVVESSCCVYPP